jgi:hypothetical protein
MTVITAAGGSCSCSSSHSRSNCQERSSPLKGLLRFTAVFKGISLWGPRLGQTAIRSILARSVSLRQAWMLSSSVNLRPGFSSVFYPQVYLLRFVTNVSFILCLSNIPPIQCQEKGRGEERRGEELGTQNHWVSGVCLSSEILSNYKTQRFGNLICFRHQVGELAKFST